MKEAQERIAALAVLEEARRQAMMFGDDDFDGDLESAETIAIIVAAFEIATKNLSAERKSNLLTGKWE